MKYYTHFPDLSNGEMEKTKRFVGGRRSPRQNVRFNLSARIIVAAGLLLLFLSTNAIPQNPTPAINDGILEFLNISPGMVVADVGAGRGELACLMAERVGAEGRVFANEISKDLINKIDRRIGEHGLRNVTTILGEEADPRLPDQADIIVFAFVYHHIRKPPEFMQNTKKYLKLSGRLVVVAEDIARAREIDPELKNHKDPCVSDPAATAAAIEKAGFVLEKLEHLDKINRKVYLLMFKLSKEAGL